MKNYINFRKFTPLGAKVTLFVALVQIPIFIAAAMLHINEAEKVYFDTVEWHSVALAQNLGQRVADLSGYPAEMQRTLGLNIECQDLLGNNTDDGLVHVGVIGTDGIVIAHTNEPFIGKTAPTLPLDKARIGPVTALTKESLNTYIPVSSSHGSPVIAFIDIGFSRQSVDHKIRDTITYAAMMFVVFLMLSFLLIRGLINRFVIRPIQKLSEAAVALADGQHPADFDQNRADEIGLLANSFESMKNAIQEQIDDLNNEIHDRKIAEEALHASRAHLGTLVETIPDLVWVKDPKGEYLSCNAKFERLFGAKERDIIGKTDYDFVDKELADFFRAKDLTAIEAAAPTINEEKLAYADDGHVELLETIKTPMFDSDGKLVGVLGVARDITSRKAAEIELQSKEENLRTTLNSIGDAVIATDAHGSITRMNPVAEQLTGWKMDEAFGKPLLEVFNIIHADNRLVCDNPVDQVLKSGKIIGLTNHTILLSKDGSEHQIADSGAPIRNAAEVIVGVVLVFRDVSEQYELENQLRQSEKMQAIGQLAGGVAHDFNNMLGGIIGAVELLEEHVAGNAEAQSFTHLILKAATRASDLTDKLLAFSRKGRNISTALDTHLIIQEAASILEHTIDKRILMVFELDAPDSSIIGDPAQMQNAILNLGLNARDAMPEGGTLTFSSKNIDIGADKPTTKSGELIPGRYIQITISDTGTGIPGKIMDKIFEPFFTTKELGKGTGLGLAAVYGTIGDHKGDIKVRTKKGEGSAFHLYLPVNDTSSPVKQPKPETTAPSTVGGKILVVDDEFFIREISCRMLKHLGIETLSAENGEDGVKLYQQYQQEITLVLLDMAMPKMSGTEAFHAIREINPKAKVIMASGYSEDSGISELLDQGLAGFLKKPFRRAELAKVISAVLGNAGRLE